MAEGTQFCSLSAVAGIASNRLMMVTNAVGHCFSSAVADTFGAWEGEMLAVANGVGAFRDFEEVSVFCVLCED